jgi:hypothetical protein
MCSQNFSAEEEILKNGHLLVLDGLDLQVELGHVVVGRHLVAVVIAALLQQLLQVLKVLCRRKSNIFFKAS